MRSDRLRQVTELQCIISIHWKIKERICSHARISFQHLSLRRMPLLSDLETDRKGSHSWHSWFLDDVQNLDIHAVRAKILMSFFCMNM